MQRLSGEKHILVIDDEVELCETIVAALNRSGYKAFGVNDVRGAMFKLRNQTYSCILLDMRLRLDRGEELITAIRERKDVMNLSTPIVVVSGHLDGPLIKKIADKIQGALVKPFGMNALLEIVKKNVG